VNNTDNSQTLAMHIKYIDRGLTIMLL